MTTYATGLSRSVGCFSSPHSPLPHKANIPHSILDLHIIMAPQKSLPPAKVALVLSYFRTTAVAHSLKDLEKSLPAAAGISSMAVKDYLSYLSGECVLNVEKIGSGNWYWSFPADAKRSKEKLLDDARKERDKLQAQVRELLKIKRGMNRLV